jgi:hypothetical protein
MGFHYVEVCLALGSWTLVGAGSHGERFSRRGLFPRINGGHRKNRQRSPALLLRSFFSNALDFRLEVFHLPLHRDHHL